MELYSTKHISPNVMLDEAVKNGLPPDNGLYMPIRMEKMKDEFFQNIHKMSFNEIAFEVLSHLFKDYISASDLQNIIDKAFGFDAPIHWLEDEIGILELFHGPTLAFKDFGARFMGRLLEYFLRNNKEVVDILVATSGDTGSAVAHGFLNVKGIRVTILYPKDKVSEIQEKQFATLGANIRVLEVNGTFDDCQAMVKRAFLDEELQAALTLSSANSINIARLLPQSLYYFYAYSRLPHKELPLVFSVPSGNFGNLTAGLFAKELGLPIFKMIASNNDNDIFTQYLETGEFQPKPSVQTISNAMDVGNPSNFFRILDLFKNDWKAIKEVIEAYSFDDEQTEQAIKDVYAQYGYIMCPHTAVGYLGMKAYRDSTQLKANYLVLSTAHPVKFGEIVENIIEQVVEVPERLNKVLGTQKLSIPMNNDYSAFKEFLMQNK
ncbi:MAG: threonine synthase [Chitinophagales bacterium]